MFYDHRKLAGAVKFTTDGYSIDLGRIDRTDVVVNGSISSALIFDNIVFIFANVTRKRKSGICEFIVIIFLIFQFIYTL